MFSSTQNQPQQPFGGSFMSNNQQQPTVPGVRIDMTNIKSSTRFNELHDDLQKELDSIDKIISLQIKHKNDCEAMMPRHEEQLSNVPSDVEYCSRKLKGMQDLMEGDAEAVDVLRELIQKDAEHAKLSFRAIDNLKLPPQYHNSGHWPTKGSGGDSRSQGTGTRDTQDIVGYFSETSDELTGKLAKYQKNITEIELHLRGVEASTAQQIHTYISRRNGGAAAQSDEIQELAESLQDFERGILNVAGKIGSTREGVQSLQLGAFMGPMNGGATSTKRSNVY
jgi:nucleoporin p58/p45